MKSLKNSYHNASTRIRALLITGAILFVLLVSYYVFISFVVNFHAITPGESYRSAQLNKKEYENYINKYGIKSVLNLRGRNEDEQWYNDEISICSSLGVAHYDARLSAINEPPEEEIRKILEVFKSAPRPLLMHCRYGADRTGLVAAMWKVAVDGESKAQAEKQFNILYGHMPFGLTRAMDKYFDRWNPPDK